MAAPVREDYRINEQIDVPEVRLIDDAGEMLGVVSLREAMARADDLGLDLVEVSPTAQPPVCKILDYGKFKYEAQKKANAARKKQRVIEVKEIKMRPSIDDNDYNIKMRKIFSFLEEGDKVKVTMRFRGTRAGASGHRHAGADRACATRSASWPRSSSSRAWKAARWSWSWRRPSSCARGAGPSAHAQRARRPTMASTSLAPLLEASGVARREDEVVALIRGRAGGARAGFDPDAWLDLIAPPDAHELRDALRALKAELAPRPPHRAAGRRAAREPAPGAGGARRRRHDPAAHRRASQRVHPGLGDAADLAHRLHRLGRHRRGAARARGDVRRRPLHPAGRGASSTRRCSSAAT